MSCHHCPHCLTCFSEYKTYIEHFRVGGKLVFTSCPNSQRSDVNGGNNQVGGPEGTGTDHR